MRNKGVIHFGYMQLNPSHQPAPNNGFENQLSNLSTEDLKTELISLREQYAVINHAHQDRPALDKKVQKIEAILDERVAEKNAKRDGASNDERYRVGHMKSNGRDLWNDINAGGTSRDA